jgi:transcriptional regulator GlxA family with amidase domain
MRVGLESARRGALAPWQLRVAKQMLTTNLGGQISVAKVAAECQLSASHFARAFKCSTGMSPYRWLVHRRIEKAADLLRHSQLSVAEIAQICGFFDQSHLTRVFAAAQGKAPARWRQDRRGITKLVEPEAPLSTSLD